MPITTPSGYAIDGRPESPRQRPAGQEVATNANAGLAHHYGDIDDARDKGK